MLTTIVARLDKTGLRVLCGRPNCGRELAQITVMPGVVFHGIGTTELTGFTAHQTRPDERQVRFEPGWQQEESGLWSTTKRARQREDRSRYLATGNGTVLPEVAARARERLASGKALANRRPIPRQLVGGFGQANHHVALPTEARCPDCHGINRLESGSLRI